MSDITDCTPEIYAQTVLCFPASSCIVLVTPRFRLRDLIGSELMTSPLQREALLDVIERCAWLIEYYENTGVAPQTVDFLRSTLRRAMNDLEILSPSIQIEYHRLAPYERAER
jgi:hypothetical protein